MWKEANEILQFYAIANFVNLYLIILAQNRRRKYDFKVIRVNVFKEHTFMRIDIPFAFIILFVLSNVESIIYYAYVFYMYLSDKSRFMTEIFLMPKVMCLTVYFALVSVIMNATFIMMAIRERSPGLICMCIFIAVLNVYFLFDFFRKIFIPAWNWSYGISLTTTLKCS